MSRYRNLVARIERKGRLRPSSTGYGEMRERQSRISLRSIRATVCAVMIPALTGITLAQEGSPPQPKQPPQQQQPQQKLTIGYVEIDGDPRHEPIQGSDRIVLKTRAHPF